MQNKSNIKKGFTLIELVVALAILIIIFTMVFSAIASLYRVRVAYAQELVLQQNFRFAVDKISQEFRQATKGIDYDSDDIILKPEPNSIGENLEFTIFDTDLDKTCKVKYYPESQGDLTAIYRAKYSYESNAWVPLGSPQPITEDMGQLVKIYFVRQGGKVIIIIVGKIKYFGGENIVSYTSLIYSRNSPLED